MPKKKFVGEQITFALSQAEAGTTFGKNRWRSRIA